MRKHNAIGAGGSEGPGKSLAIPMDQLGIWTPTLLSRLSARLLSSGVIAPFLRVLLIMIAGLSC